MGLGYLFNIVADFTLLDDFLVDLFFFMFERASFPVNMFEC